MRPSRLISRLVPIACAAALLPALPAHAQHAGNPLARAPWYVDSQTGAAKAERAARDAGDPGAAQALATIAVTPQSQWFIAADRASSGYTLQFWRRWRDGAPGSIAAITLHGLPQQVCAGDNAPGAANANSYRSWIDGYARLIGDQRVVVFLEPDALAAATCLSGGDRTQRLGLIAYAARRLSALPNTGVYIDAGAGDWLGARRVASLLRAAGARYARGFVVNTTHYDWTSREVGYGMRVSRMLGGKHFVVNTAFNGNGPQVVGRNYHAWCNPRGRSLGPVPTVKTGNPRVDAYFWVGNPGLSDGHCNGGPAVGHFWQDWALELVRDTRAAPDFPVARP